MDCSRIFILFGLSINTLASLIMLAPLLKTTRNVEEEFIEKMDKDGNFTQKKHKKDKRLGIIGLILFVFGFVFQIVGMLI